MARLNGHDRGQIILVAGFVLAVIFVALALVVNSAIFTGNLATRGETSGASDALLYRHEVESGVANVTAYVNEHNTTGLVANVTDSLDNVSSQAGIQHARRGRIVSVSFVSDSELVRARFRNNASAEYTNESGASDWRPVEDVGTVRRFAFNVTGGLAENESDAFHVYVNDTATGDWWKLVLNESSGGSTTNVIVDSNANPPVTCTSGEAIVNVTVSGPSADGEVDGTDCAGLTDANRTYTGFSPGDVLVRYTHAENATGNYSVVVENDGGEPTINQGNFNATTPTVDAWIDHLEVAYTYESASVRYNTTFTVRPGDSDG